MIDMYTNDIHGRIFFVNFDHFDPGMAEVGVYNADGTVSGRWVDNMTAHEIVDAVYRTLKYTEGGYYTFHLDEQRKYDTPRFYDCHPHDAWHMAMDEVPA